LKNNKTVVENNRVMCYCVNNRQNQTKTKRKPKNGKETTMSKYFIDCLLVKGEEIIECEITKDGLLLIFKSNNIKQLLQKYDENNKGWFFNSSHDRYIAEKNYNTISANPQIAWENGYKIIT